MALSNINNLDALDTVANIGAGGEAIIKEAITTTFKRFLGDESRLINLFVGQLAAEGFTPDVGVVYVIESPTVRLSISKAAAGQYYVEAYLNVSSVWTLVNKAPLRVL